MFYSFYLTHFLFATKLKLCIHQLKNNWKGLGYLLFFEILFVGTVLVRLSNLDNSLWYISPFFFLVIGLSGSNLGKTLQLSLHITTQNLFLSFESSNARKISLEGRRIKILGTQWWEKLGGERFFPSSRGGDWPRMTLWSYFSLMRLISELLGWFLMFPSIFQGENKHLKP